MNSQNWVGLLDADVLIAAHRNYYAPDLCPGFWECLAHHLTTGRLLIIERVSSEITYPPELIRWLGQVPGHAIVSTSASHVVQAYTKIMDWVQDSSQFTQAAKDAFAGKADGWLVAYAMGGNTHVVVTNEVYDPNIRREVKLPNICKQFEVDYQDTYEMLRILGARFEWEGHLI